MLGRATVALIAAVVALALLELAARWLLDDIGTTGDNTSWFAERWRATQRPLRNSLGFREREFDPTVAPGAYRIAVVGDSFTYGQGIAEPERLTERLQRALDAGGGAFEVLNFGQPGADYEQNTHNLSVALARARPDFVLIEWFLNDIDDPEHHRPRPWPLLPKVHYLVNPRSALYFVLNKVWFDLQMISGLIDYDRWYRDQYGAADRPLARRARQRLERLLRLPAAEGIPVAMVLWPPTLVAGHDSAAYDFIYREVLGTCESEGVPCFGLRAAFEARAGDELVVNRFDAHPNGRANEIAAEAVLGALGEGWRTMARSKASRPRS